MSRPHRVSIRILGATLVGAGIWTVLSVWAVPRLIESGWSGDSVPFVNAVFAGRAEHPFEEYLASWRGVWPGLLVNLFGLGVLLALAVRPETRALARRAFGSTVPEIFHATPKLMLAVIVLSLAVSEWYPLSQFPMFSTFQSSGGYVWVSDAADEPLPTVSRLGVRGDEVEKIFQRDLEVERELRGVTVPGWYIGSGTPRNAVVEAAAQRTLLYLRDERSERREALKLWRTRLVLTGGEIQRELELLAEVPPG